MTSVLSFCAWNPWVSVCRWFKEPSIAFSAVGVDSRSSIFGVGSNTAAVAGPVDIIAMMGGDDDAAAAGAAALAAARAARKPKRI